MPDQEPGCQQAAQDLPRITEAGNKRKGNCLPQVGRKQRVVYNAAMPQKLAALFYVRDAAHGGGFACARRGDQKIFPPDHIIIKMRK